MKELRSSPIAIVLLGVAVVVAWTLGQEPVTGQAPADPEPQAAVTAPADVPVTTSGRYIAEPVLREGPRVLAPAVPDVPGVNIALEDRNGQSMAKLHSALQRAERGEGQARLLFFGASHVASDLFTGVIRQKLQERFGDAGHGFVLPVHPWRRYRHLGVNIESNHGRWNSTKVRTLTSDVDHFGLAGVFVESDQAGAFGMVSTARNGVGQNASLFDLYYLKQPGGGDFDVIIDGRRQERVSTQATSRGTGYATYRVPDGPHRFKVQVRRGGNVRLFGVAVERQNPGVIVDTVGINGSRARYHLMWEDQMYREHLARRNPDLVVLAYGTNESGDDLPIERYEEQLNQVVSRVRETVPNASCLLIGPSDRPVRVNDETYEDRPRTSMLIEVQHRVAVQQGCAFFDLVSFSGGPLSMTDWVAMQPRYGQPDHIHYTRRGYLRLGEVLHNALMEGYPASSGESTEATPAP